MFSGTCKIDSANFLFFVQFLLLCVVVANRLWLFVRLLLVLMRVSGLVEIITRISMIVRQADTSWFPKAVFLVFLTVVASQAYKNKNLMISELAWLAPLTLLLTSFHVNLQASGEQVCWFIMEACQGDFLEG